ncbi:MAG: ornithine cyclodeaminase [Lachnospiraceae bacterium]|nr:ornithine cyclodeaminase [Lachnospiraceae bacterium]
MKVIDFETIRRMNIVPEQCYRWAEKMIADKKKTILPPKISLRPREGIFVNTMPSILDNGFGGVKVVTRYPEREPSLDSKILLMDVKTGEFLALMDANWITAMRTGAVAAHSVITLAKTDYETVAIMGLGNTARATLLILASVEKNRHFKIKILRYKQQAEDFARRFEDLENIEFTIVDTYEELIKGSDVVISCVTYFADDVCADEYFDEGVTVIPVHTRGFTNCDLFFDKVYADDTGHVDNFKNFSKFKKFAEMCDVVNGVVPGRENDKERILAYNIGLSIHDINFAGHIYDLLKEEKTAISAKNLPDADMHDPSDKFWI